MTALDALPRGRHRRQPLHRRVLARIRRPRHPQWPCWLLNWAWNRQATPYVPHIPGIEDARHDAFMVRIEAHAVPPTAKAQAALAALYGVLHHEHGFYVPPLTDTSGVPPAAVLDDVEDPRWAHLNRQWSDDTGTFRKLIEDM